MTGTPTVGKSPADALSAFAAELVKLPAILPTAQGVLLRDARGQISRTDAATARERVQATPHLLCHGKAVARRLGLDPFPCFDLLELFAFTRPARFALPTVGGLQQVLELEAGADQLEAMNGIGAALLAELAAPLRADRQQAAAIAVTMQEGGWLWGTLVRRALGTEAAEPDKTSLYRAFAVWQSAPEWEERSPPPLPGTAAVEPPEARARLDLLLSSRGEVREARPQQADYASAASAAFRPRQNEASPNLILAEAGTGVGKTLGYLAPASLWAERNEAPVWIATYTRNLQRQIDDELQRLGDIIPTDDVVVRKGRENFLCLLNFEEAIQRIATTPRNAVPLGLLTRWAHASRDGALIAGDLPGWLADLAGRGRTQALADRRGECIYAACPHYKRCYIERNTRAAKYARIVVANHALLLYHAATMASEASENLPTHLVFDEGHHLFDAADSAFSIALTAQEAAEQRRWLLGSETGRGSRARGLARRVEDLLAGDEEGMAALDAAQEAGRCLPAQEWAKRLSDGTPKGAGEVFFAALRAHIYARSGGDDDGLYDLEAPPLPLSEEAIAATAAFSNGLMKLIEPLTTIRRRLTRLLDERADDWDSDTRQRADALARGIQRRIDTTFRGWWSSLAALHDRARAALATANDNQQQADAALAVSMTPEAMVDWFALTRINGRESDVGFFRHWIDPTEPLAEAVLKHVQGVVVTSATLTDAAGDDEQRWESAERRSGAKHLSGQPIRVQVRSPFDYATQTRAFIITDVNRNDMEQVAGAYRALFMASKGGALGLFTAIQRLRAVHQRLAPALEMAGLPLYAQHADGLDPATLIDIFRSERDACLLGTDAIRDGVDVPGDALRLVVFDRVPWPRPSLIHKARRQQLGGQAYDDGLIRLKLRQAFGRLVRRADDRGVFVMLDSAFPSRLLGAFPEGVEPQRVGLKDALAGISTFMTATPEG